MTKKWKEIKPHVYRLYVQQKKPLLQVQRMLYKHYDFKASIRAYRLNIRKWGYRKNGCTAKGGPPRGPVPSRTTPPGTQVDVQRDSSLLGDGNERGPSLDSRALAIVDHLESGRDSRWTTPLHQAVIERRLEDVECLLQNPELVSVRDTLDNQPIHYAYQNNADNDDNGKIVSIIKLLLAKGADPVSPGLRKISPLHRWASWDEVLEFVLPQCPQLNVKDFAGDSPLHWALRLPFKTKSTWIAISALIKAGADVDEANDSGESPFHVVLDLYEKFQPGSLVEMDLFLKHSKSVNKPVRNGRGRLPFDIFLACPHTENFMRKHSLVGYWAEVIQHFITKGADPNARLDSGEPLLHACLQRFMHLAEDSRSDPATIALGQLIGLICEKVDNEILGLTGNSPLHQLAWSMPFGLESGSSDTNSVKALLRRGANPNALNRMGATPLMLLLRHVPIGSLGLIETVKALLGAGGDCMQPDYLGDRPLYVILKSLSGWSDRSEIVRLCLESMVMAAENGRVYEDASGSRHTIWDADWWNSWTSACCSHEWQKWRNHGSGVAEQLPLSEENKAFVFMVAYEVLARRCVEKLKRDYESCSCGSERALIAMETLSVMADFQSDWGN